MKPAQLAEKWKAEGEGLRVRYAHDQLAQLCEVHAAELKSALDEEANEPLTLRQAAEESGYAARTLRAKVASGEIPNAGRRNAPRVRRRDLPRKASSRRRDGFDAVTHARDVHGGNAASGVKTP